jgi:hypothetical protein
MAGGIPGMGDMAFEKRSNSVPVQRRLQHSLLYPNFAPAKRPFTRCLPAFWLMDEGGRTQAASSESRKDGCPMAVKACMLPGCRNEALASAR